MSRRTRGGLSEEDRALWQAVVKATRPLKPKRRDVKAAAGTEKAVAEATATPAAANKGAMSRPVKRAPTGERRPPPLVPLGRKERTRLSRGHRPIDARLDLHGMTQQRAHRALFSFLQAACADGATFVLVITGKGRVGASENERGVLRRQVPLWLEQVEFRALVVGFEAAHLSHGGEGAIYVRLRKR